MSTINTVIVLWLSAVSVVLLVVIRQIAVIGLRLDSTQYDGQDPVDDGLELRSPIPDVFRRWIGGDDGPEFVLVVSTTCTVCVDLIAELPDAGYGAPVLLLLPGRSDAMAQLRDQVPAAIPHVVDPDATRYVNQLQVRTVPFVFEFRRGELVAKAAVRGSDHLARFIKEALSVPDSELLQNLEEATLETGDQLGSSQNPEGEAVNEPATTRS